MIGVTFKLGSYAVCICGARVDSLPEKGAERLSKRLWEPRLPWGRVTVASTDAGAENGSSSARGR